MTASNLFIQECSRVSKPLPDNWYTSMGSFQELSGREAAGSSFNLYCCFSSSRYCFASSWYRGRDAGGAWPSMGRGKRGDCLTDALRRLHGAESSSASLKKKRRFGDCSFKRRRATLSRCKRIWRVNEISERVRSWLIPLTDGKWFPHSLWGWREVKE